MGHRRFEFALLVAAFLVFSLPQALLHSQGRGGGDRGGGGDQGGGRGGFSRGGGAPGGSRGGFGGGPADFLKRLDRNGNGVLDPEEQQGPASFILRRMQERDPKIVPGKPIKIETLSGAIQQARESRTSGTDRSSSRSEPEPVEIEPLVLGFGSEDEPPAPIPGFGPGAEEFALQITEEDRREAKRNLDRYDRNRDGILDEQELRSGRWREPALMTDRNGDGKLSLRELELRYAVRRNNAPSPSSQASNSRDSSNDRSRGSYTRRDAGSRDTKGDAKKSSKSKRSKSKSYTVAGADEIIADLKLQAWFARDDKNQDGQVQMSEFSSSWSDKTAADFAQFDMNNDGVITPQEAQIAEEEGKVRGSPSSSSGSSYTKRSSSRSRTKDSGSSKESSSDTGSSSDADEPDDAAASLSSTTTEVDSRYVKHAVSYIRQYDENKDGVLTEAEWKKMSKDYSGADKDSDGKITPQELAAALGG